ncbi:MAG: head-tail connector protein, partial [Synergistaceae bacterium]|nr:head-tail connector protein [Synergistaceae bacterium]
MKQETEIDLRKLTRELAAMETIRTRYMPVWQEISEYILPGRGIFDKSEPNQGDRRDKKIIDPTAPQALHVLSAGLQGGLTSPSRPWFRLTVSDSELADYAPVRLWLDDVERRIFHVMSQTNIYNSLHTLYQEVGAFGTGCMLIEEDIRHILLAQTFTVGEYFLSYGVDGRPNRFARSFWLTAQQMIEQFDEDNLSDAVKEAYQAGRGDQYFRVCHMIYPDEDARTEIGEMRFLSVYWEDGRVGENKTLKTGRYVEMPVIAPRWEVTGGDFYGRAPGWDTLGEAKTLQLLRKNYLQAAEISIAPPLVGHNSLRRSHAHDNVFRPNSITYVDGTDPNMGFRPLYQVQPDANGQVAAIMDSREIIKKAFFADLFLAILRNPDKNMTATQVNAINQEQMMMIGPVFERLDYELLDPMIVRVFGIMDRLGLIAPPPEELSGQELKIEYISMLAQAQQMVGLEGIDRLTSFVGTVAQIQAGAGVQPDVLDKIDVHESVDQYARMLGVQAAVIRSDEAVAEMQALRQAEQQQAQQMAAMQQMAQAANQGAGAAKQAADAGLLDTSGEQPEDTAGLDGISQMLGVPD